ncbi:MAG: aminotransferase class I/II-fold pyridoxal phosphate-dependent enzyme [Clostridiales bacterium]|nr:aminotransferase class I/II-fold pyridoxal phosphate-dependent enzyme [Clostridiales bacterium]
MNYDKILNPTVKDIKPSGIRKYFDIVEEMDNVISLGVGEPDFATPWHICSAGVHSLENGHTKYTSNRGRKELREELARFMERKYRLTYDPMEEILVTVGGSEAIDAAIRALVQPGDEVLIVEPSFVCYEPITRLAGGIPVSLKTRAEDNFKLTPEALKEKITDKTKLLIFPFPCNPTGAVMRREDLEGIAAVLRDTNVMVLSDEVYAELTFGDRKHVSIAELEGMKERTVIAGGFSKTYSMTGWRLGYACGPAPVLLQITKIHQFAIMCAPTTSQYAAIEALKNGDEDIKKMRNEYDLRRRFIVDRFREIGMDCFEPEGAFYAFPSIKKFGMSSDEFCKQLLMAERVALIPGSAFGESGEGHVRASYCYSIEHLKEAAQRVQNFVSKL